MFRPIPEGAGPLEVVHRALIGLAEGFIVGGPLGGVAGFGQGFIAERGGGGFPKKASKASKFTGLNPGAGLGGSSGFAPSGGCDPGFERGPNGRCRATGIRGSMERFIPGGATGFQEDGVTVRGGFNMPAFAPEVVGNISRVDGSTGPILRCPRGTVLATDDLCYAKGTKGLAAFRKWKPAPPAFLPRRDMVCLRRAVAIKKNKTNRALFRELGLG